MKLYSWCLELFYGPFLCLIVEILAILIINQDKWH